MAAMAVTVIGMLAEATLGVAVGGVAVLALFVVFKAASEAVVVQMMRRDGVARVTRTRPRAEEKIGHLPISALVNAANSGADLPRILTIAAPGLADRVLPRPTLSPQDAQTLSDWLIQPNDCLRRPRGVGRAQSRKAYCFPVPRASAGSPPVSEFRPRGQSPFGHCPRPETDDWARPVWRD